MPNQKNIAIIKSQPSIYYGGREKQLTTLAAAWNDASKNIVLFSNCSIISSEFQKRSLNNKKIWLSKNPIGLKNSLIFSFLLIPLSIYSFFFLLYLKIKKINCLYLIDIPEKLLLTIPAKILGINVIWEEFNIYPWHFFNPYKLLWLTISRAAKIFTFSNAAKNNLIKKGLSKKINTIYPGINLAEMKNQETLFNTLGDKNIQPQKLFKIGTICHLSKKNGLEYLLQALKIIVEIIPEAQLVIIGTGAERSNLNWLVRKLGLERHIWFMGFQENYYHWIKSFDLFTMPALASNSINFAIVEAMAHFCPIIATNIAGMNEIVKDGVCGILIKPANSDILAQTVINLYRAKQIRKEMGENSQKRARAVFNIERVIEDFEKIL